MHLVWQEEWDKLRDRVKVTMIAHPKRSPAYYVYHRFPGEIWRKHQPRCRTMMKGEGRAWVAMEKREGQPKAHE
jgi:hypothetical protein